MSQRFLWLVEAELPKFVRVIQVRTSPGGMHEYLVDTQEVSPRIEGPAQVAKRIAISEKRKEAGKKSALARASKYGSPNPNANKKNKPEQLPTNKREQREQRAEAIYKLYPKRDGDTRKQFGLRVIEKQMKSEADWADFERAVMKYAKDCARKGTKGNYVMQFGTFCGEPWREYAELARKENQRQTEKLALRFDDEFGW